MALWGLAFFLVVEVSIFLPLYIAGLPVAYFASRWADFKMVPSRFDPTRQILVYTNPFLDGWVGNYEDGLAFGYFTPFKWFLRNPVTNMRFWPIVSTKPSTDTHWVGSVNEVPNDGVPGGFIAWSGPYVGFRWQSLKYGVWIGWKINPRDALVPCGDYRRWGIGTATQVMKF
jgi:hypothetical protein